MQKSSYAISHNSTVLLESINFGLITFDFDVDEDIKNLEDAHKSMMNFMENFSAEFSFEDYPMNKEKYKNLNQSDLKNVNQKLKEFDKAINKVSDKFQNSFRKGKEILDGID